MVFTFIAILLFSNGYQFQSKYDFCKSNDFKFEYCKVEKKLHDNGRKE